MAKREVINNEPEYTIGIAARKLNVSVHALRLYEREGLIRPFRTETNRRLYSDVEIRKVGWIKRMIHEHGLNFEGIRRLIALVPCYKHVKSCNKEMRDNCGYIAAKDRPCWSYDTPCAAEQEGNGCRDCPVYLGIYDYEDVQRMVYVS